MKSTTCLRLICASLAMAFYTPANAQGVIGTIAGTGVAGFSGDGGPAISAMFWSPAGVATDGRGNIYIADYNNHRVRMIDRVTGNVSTIAGSGVGYYSGMGGPATMAGMEYPNSMFVDALGNYYMTDYFADCSYGVDAATGVMSNRCGHNHQGHSGDGGDAPLATMELPRQVTQDLEGNTYIADYGNNCVRRIDKVTDIVTTITGTSHGFSPDGTPAASCLWGSIEGVCVDAFGNIYVSDGSNHVVRKIDLAGNVYTVAGNRLFGYSGDGGSALAASVGTPGALHVNKAGNLFICDPAMSVVRVVNIYPTSSGIINTLAGTGTGGYSGDGGTPTSARLNGPSGVWEDALTGNIYIADKGNNVIRSVSHSGYRAANNGNTGAIAASQATIFPNPSNGSFIVTGSLSSVEVFNILGEKVYSQPGTGEQTMVTINQPAGVYNVALRSETGDVSYHKILIEK